MLRSCVGVVAQFDKIKFWLASTNFVRKVEKNLVAARSKAEFDSFADLTRLHPRHYEAFSNFICEITAEKPPPPPPPPAYNIKENLLFYTQLVYKSILYKNFSTLFLSLFSKAHTVLRNLSTQTQIFYPCIHCPEPFHEPQT